MSKFIKIWDSYESYFANYGAAEVGRLVLGAMQYSFTGVEPEFSGSEKYVWPAIKRDLDLDEDFNQKQRENGQKGGRPANNVKTQQNPTKPNETQQNPNEPRQKTKDKRQKNNPPISPQGTDAWTAFWAAYPKKVAKLDAKKAWDRLAPDAGAVSAIMQGLARLKQSDQWTRDEGRYICNPSTFINQRRWEDETGPADAEPEELPTKPVLDHRLTLAEIAAGKQDRVVGFKHYTSREEYDADETAEYYADTMTDAERNDVEWLKPS